MGIGGAALATTTGYLSGSILISYYFFKKERTLQFIKLKANSFLSYLKEIADLWIFLCFNSTVFNFKIVCHKLFGWTYYW